ncbi:hypothetical protein CR513_61051, partial [Mucuna pruriens]
MATASSLSQGSIISFSRTPTITVEKLNWKNYRAWSDSVELWFLGQGFHDHLEKQEAEIPEENRAPWMKLDCQLCVILWQSVSPELLEILRPSPLESSSLETHNQDILQPSSSIHSQVELSPPSMSTCQSRTQEMGTPVCEDSLDSCPLPSTDPTPDPLPSSPSHDSDIGWPIALRKGIHSTRNPHPIYLSYH